MQDIIAQDGGTFVMHIGLKGGGGGRARGNIRGAWRETRGFRKPKSMPEGQRPTTLSEAIFCADAFQANILHAFHLASRLTVDDLDRLLGSDSERSGDEEEYKRPEVFSESEPETVECEEGCACPHCTLPSEPEYDITESDESSDPDFVNYDHTDVAALAPRGPVL